jgi:prepilin-type N-terminal cleavage/methylation domain-containing protein
MRRDASINGGFTLVEIMIVVAIIGMLATIAIPNYVKAREEARKTTCISNLQQVEGAVQQWAVALNKDPGETVTYQDISGYLRNAVVCPAGGRSFDDSYSLKMVDERPTCVRNPEKHKLLP